MNQSSISSVKIQDKKIFINGKETILIGGEIHYFRVSRQYWRTVLMRLKDCGCNFVSTYIPWNVHEREEGNVDIEGRNNPDLDLGAFLDLAHEIGLYVIVRPGPYVMAELRYDGIPDWVFQNYPEVEAVSKDETPHPGKIVSYMHPTYLKLVQKWYDTVYKIISPRIVSKGGPVLMIQLDNEVGMLHWVHGCPDYNDITVSLFLNWLVNKYGIQKASEILYIPVSAMENSSHEMIINALRNPKKENAMKIHREFHLFARDYFKMYIAELKKMAEKYVSDIPFIINVHGCDQGSAKTFPIGLSQLSKVSDLENVYMAVDYYIGDINFGNFFELMFANAFTEAVQPESQPLFSVEFQCGRFSDYPQLQPSTPALTARLCIANGMNLINYYMYADGENPPGCEVFGHRHLWGGPLDPHGNPRNSYWTIQRSTKGIIAIKDALAKTKQEHVVHIGLIPDYYMTEYPLPETADFIEELRMFREELFFNGLAKALAINNYVYKGYDLSKGDSIDVEKIPSMFVFSTRYMEADIQQKLVTYLESGGKMVLYPEIPQMDMYGNPCTILQDALGVEIVDRPKHTWFDRGFYDYPEVDNVGYAYAALMKPVEHAYAFHTTGNAVAVERNVGKGKCVIYTTATLHTHRYLDPIVHDLAKRIGVKPLVDTHEWNGEQLLVISRVGEVGRVLFIANYDSYEKALPITFGGKKLFEGKKFRIPAHTCFMLPLELKILPDVVVDESTSEILDIKEFKDCIQVAFERCQDSDKVIISTHYNVQAQKGCTVRKEGNKWVITSTSDDITKGPMSILLVRNE